VTVTRVAYQRLFQCLQELLKHNGKFGFRFTKLRFKSDPAHTIFPFRSVQSQLSSCRDSRKPLTGRKFVSFAGSYCLHMTLWTSQIWNQLYWCRSWDWNNWPILSQE